MVRLPAARRPAALAAAAGLLSLTALVVAPAAADPPADDTPAATDTGPSGAGRESGVVRTDRGRVRGRVEAGHVAYEGIPYAAPPVGERRFAPPARAAAWSGVRDATTPGPVCPQAGADSEGEPIVAGDEDCLHVNVTVPRDRDRAQERGRAKPVVVWVHGGGFVSGAGAEYGAAALAERGVVVVTLDHRLGPLGFLSTPALDRPGAPSGNHGLEDQQAALRWVRRNAAAFGGDPGNVTLAGQSAGAFSVCAHLAAPGSRGLFNRAVVQSGPCANPMVTKAEADRRGAAATASLGCDTAADVAACLRAQPVAALLDLTPPGYPPTSVMRDRMWLPVVGTPVLPRQPGEALRAGSAAGVPLLIGSMRDEMRPFVGFAYDAGGRPLTAAAYEALVTRTFGADAPAILERYPAGDFPSPALALATLLSDWGGQLGACSTLRTARDAARHAPVYAYELGEDSGLVVEGFPLGAYHGWDLPFLWEVKIPGAGYPELTTAQAALSVRLVDYWATFARTGDPNHRHAPRWDRFRSGTGSGNGDGTVLGLAAGDGGIAPVPNASDRRCDLWSGIDADADADADGDDR